MSDFTIKKRSRMPELTATLLQYVNGPAIVLDPTPGKDSVNFVMKGIDGAAKGVVVIDALATIVDGPNGKVKYAWSATDTLIPGNYSGEWVITFFGGKPETVPADGFISIEITESLT
jgi:hypothetical protein